MTLPTALRRITPFVLGVVALALAVGSSLGNWRALFDPRAAAVTLLLPWLALAVTDSWGSARAAATDLFCADPAFLPAGRRRASASRIDMLASASIAAGVVAATLAFVAALNGLARAGGEAAPNAWIGITAGLMLGPIYGLLLKALLYDPAATALRAAASELDEVLDGA